MAEVHHVISLVIYLVHVNRVRLDDIGIISPYRRQVGFMRSFNVRLKNYMHCGFA